MFSLLGNASIPKVRQSDDIALNTLKHLGKLWHSVSLAGDVIPDMGENNFNTKIGKQLSICNHEERHHRISTTTMPLYLDY